MTCDNKKDSLFINIHQTYCKMIYDIVYDVAFMLHLWDAGCSRQASHFVLYNLGEGLTKSPNVVLYIYFFSL